MNLVPTASTTAALALGDALAMAVLVEKGSGRRTSPTSTRAASSAAPDAGPAAHARRGRRADRRPRDADARRHLHDVQQGLGLTAVVDEAGRLVGIITDGDLRRQMAVTPDIQSLVARDVMTPDPIAVGPETLAVEALALLERRKITAVVVIDDDRRVAGVLHLHDLWRTGMV